MSLLPRSSEIQRLEKNKIH